VQALVAGKRYVSFNAGSMARQKIDFVTEQTLFLCILPITAEGSLRAYVIIEGDRKSGPLVHSDAALLFISDTINYMIEKKSGETRLVSREEEPAPSSGAAVPQAIRAIEELDVDRGLSLIGGSEEQYAELLRISAGVFLDGIKKMRNFYQKDLPAFTIEVHGMKGALYAIGALNLGDKARELETAAKEGDAGFCAEAYPVFEERLNALSMRLAAAAGRQRAAPRRGPGRLGELKEVLQKILEYSQNFDSAKAIAGVAPLLEYSWDEQDVPAAAPELSSTEGGSSIGETLEKIAGFLENIDYDGAEDLISALLKTLGDAGV
jgi:HPt (histidine-containing phosphotransfer) domain-containing protein